MYLPFDALYYTTIVKICNRKVINKTNFQPGRPKYWHPGLTLYFIYLMDFDYSSARHFLA